MSNMSYCRFRNTLSDLQDCLETLELIEQHDGLGTLRDLLAGADDVMQDLTDAADIENHRSMVQEMSEADLSEDEERAAHELIHLCKLVAEFDLT